jgi:multidrug efflux pump subunit AcrA (membrane-fusion protein)
MTQLASAARRSLESHNARRSRLLSAAAGYARPRGGLSLSDRAAPDAEAFGRRRGVVREVDVDCGDRVKKGQLVARLDTGVEEAEVQIGKLRASNEADIAGARAKLDAAWLMLGRKTELRDKTYGSRAELQDAEAEARVAEAQLQGATLARDQAALEARRAEATLRLRDVRSPVDGVVM